VHIPTAEENGSNPFKSRFESECTHQMILDGGIGRRLAKDKILHIEGKGPVAGTAVSHSQFLLQRCEERLVMQGANPCPVVTFL
jgi:hypothetical protein